MPKRTDIKKILVIGSGPIVIGQACEFDYSGTQACKALREEGYEVVLVNSNPATIMTDPAVADRTYVEPLTAEVVELILERERPDALLPTVGGQTGLNVTVALGESGALERHDVKLIGANLEAIQKAEDRQRFKEAMAAIGLETPRSGTVNTADEARELLEEIGFPAIIRPSFTLGGTGGGTAYNIEEFEQIVAEGLDASPTTQVLIEESVLGWKEYELEVMRDLNDNVVVICSIENFDAMGVHTGDSITVAPAQTLTDKEYQRMRDAAIAVIREIGVETGGSNIQFAVDPATGRMVVIEMNPRVSRSSALASKATGFPIAKIAAKLAVGYTLDEIPNDITRDTPASFEPTLDYVVVKVPRWAFEKFPHTNPVLGTQMKSVGEAMAMGRSFREALQKALRSLEIGCFGFGADGRKSIDPKRLREKLTTPNWERMFYIRYALQSGMSVDAIAEFTGIDPWFLSQLEALVHMEGRVRGFSLETVPPALIRQAKRDGFSDVQLAHLLGCTEDQVRERRAEEGILAVYKRVDTCAAEFEAHTPYLYSTYEEECEAEPTDRRKIMILGGGPNRIGQGIEFDYCCCHASFALAELGIETIMVNCNPETVSTDYDTSDRLYFEPLTLEDVLRIVDVERPEGVIVQFGGQTPLGLALPLQRRGVKILGTSPDAIDLAEDRQRFGDLLAELGIPAPAWGTARTLEEARTIAERIGYPLLVRPSYVLGGRAMFISHDESTLEETMRRAMEAAPDHPVLLDRFLEDAYEVDVDCLADGEDVVVAGIMQHIEEAGVHSGDSACVIPPFHTTVVERLPQLREYSHALARALGVRGLMNVQYAIKDDTVYVLEVNPRASRTVPFVAKATGIPLAGLAAKIMTGKTLRELGLVEEPEVRGRFVKESVFPFIKFPSEDPVLGPEMRSTGEVMGVAEGFGQAFAKAQLAAGQPLPREGRAFLSVHDNDKAALVPVARGLAELGFDIVATAGTQSFLRERGIPCEQVFKVLEGRPNIVDRLKNGEIELIINTPLGAESYFDEKALRRAATDRGIPLVTTLSGAHATVQAIRDLKQQTLEVRSLQEIYDAR
ncbi:MAG: carbamoyl-phosphate synthase large subunit [Acidobacteria bacterium]|nr:carbamoyl-phosphate synthase large subunit [Acidobacteriota bacterium]NIM60789.1 carbamoyl-phosphate synthase large subunit [Acidobacteriota bacterium]NIQ83474.1 carbamoyl-phosphate synthase large subunit [Acidobacteriota bacterium]NIT09715.1 carbamoyl-phosphate synthase large subunit [Acidobacteriota bacterium]